ncbi:MAG: hypothetical protein WA139_04680 [Candidatus Aenigmatarchaeota archaeon]
MNRKILAAIILALLLATAAALAITDIYQEYYAKWNKEKYPDGYIVITNKSGDINITLNVSEQVFDASGK